jgi:hypothetical protein
MALLGKVSDMELGRRFACSSSTVSIIRKRHGIPVFDPCAHPEFMPLLGVIPDDELAFRVGCSVATVKNRRKAFALPGKKSSVEVGADWQAKHLETVLPLLGTMSDADLARRYGGFGSRYAQLRKKHGIAAFQPEKSGPLESGPERKQQQRPAASEARKLSRFRRRKPTYTLPDEVMARLGKVNDSQLSLESGVPYQRIKHYRTWLQIPAYRKRRVIEQELIDSLGKMKDEDVAAKFGRTHSWVRKERKKRGIPGFKFESIPGLIESLGTMHDYAVAEKFGVSSNWVQKTRSERGIPIFNPNKVRASDSDQV